ncbi:MAG: alpha/beta hydrolase [Kofleriaceae bacterium]
MQATSADGVAITYEVTGAGPVALVFVHGWLGSKRWWDATRDDFAATHTVVALDLAGHGDAGGERAAWSVAAYAADIAAVVRQLANARVVLVGHSMAGAYVVEASLGLPQVAAVVLVDTLKNLDRIIPPDQVAQMLALYRTDYRATVENVLAPYLYAPTTPPQVQARLTAEFLQVAGPRAAQLLEPLYRTDIRVAAAQVTVPVRAINGDLHPTDDAVNRTYFRDYASTLLPGVGHYPMLEQPAAFAAALADTLAGLGLA